MGWDPVPGVGAPAGSGATRERGASSSLRATAGDKQDKRASKKIREEGVEDRERDVVAVKR